LNIEIFHDRKTKALKEFQITTAPNLPLDETVIKNLSEYSMQMMSDFMEPNSTVFLEMKTQNKYKIH